MPNPLPILAMLVCYQLEDRSRWFILAFATSCALGATYEFAGHAWPFGLIEGLWSIVAIRRWRLAKGSRRRITQVGS
jgi:hypothetical protein